MPARASATTTQGTGSGGRCLGRPVPGVTRRPRGPDTEAAGSGPRSAGSHTWLVGLVLLGAAVRAWQLGAFGATFDESFTAMAGRRSVGDLLDYLRAHDSHPPLDYLLRAPIARAGLSDAALRLPSFVFAVAALALFAWWMRDRGRLGL